MSFNEFSFCIKSLNLTRFLKVLSQVLSIIPVMCPFLMFELNDIWT